MFKKPVSLAALVAFAALTTTAPSNALAGLNFFAKGAHAVGDSAEIETEVKLGANELHIPIKIDPVPAEELEKFTPQALRGNFLNLAKQDLKRSLVAKKVLQLKNQYPDLAAYLSQHPDLEINLHHLQEAARFQGVEVQKLSEIVKNSEADPSFKQSFVITKLQETLANAEKLETFYPGIKPILAAHPDLLNLLQKNPYVFQPLGSAASRSAHLLADFPRQSITFFAAMGAVYYGQLLTNSASNPLAIEQQIDSQFDPVTHLSFAAFMLANGLATEPLMRSFSQHDWGRFSVPYMGLMAGMVASQVTSEMMTKYKDMPACAASMMSQGSVMGGSCDKVMKAFNSTTPAEKFNNFTPGLLSLATSMVLSSAVEGMIRSGMDKGLLAIAEGGLGKKILASSVADGAMDKAIVATLEREIIQKQVIKMSFGLAEGGPITKFALSVGSTVAPMLLQNTLFSAISQGVDKSVHDLYRNSIDTVNFIQHDAKLMNSIGSAQSFAREDRRKVLLEIEDFGHDMQIWRDANMSDFAQAQAEWNMYLTDLRTNYLNARDFYEGFLTKLADEHTADDGSGDNFHHDTSISLDLVSPLVGIKMKVDGPETNSTMLMYTDNARETVSLQKLTLVDAANSLAADLKNIGYDVDHASNDKTVTALKSIITAFRSGDDKQIKEKLILMVGLARMGPLTFDISRFSFTDQRVVHILAQTLVNIGLDRKTLAKSASLSSQPGQSFLFGWDAKFDEGLGGAKLKTGRLGGLNINMNAPRTLAEYYAAAMVLGPNAEEPGSLIQKHLGFSARFTPPRIAIDGTPSLQNVVNVGQPIGPDLYFRPIMDLPLTFTAAGAPAHKFANMWEFLRTEHVSNKVYNRKDLTLFQPWWDKNVDTQFVKAWFDFEVKYQKIIANFRQSFFTPTKADDAQWFKTLLNEGPVGNGTITALNQEFQVYLITLGRVLDPSLTTEKISQIPGYNQHFLGGQADRQTLLYNLRKLDTVHWNTPWQREIVASLQMVEQSVVNVRVFEAKRQDGQIVQATIAPPINVNEFRARLVELKRRLAFMKNAAAQRIGPLDKPQTVDQYLAAFCITQMETIADQIQTLAAIASAVSYQDFKDGKVLPLSCRALEAQGTKNSADREAAKECEASQVRPGSGTKDVTKND